MYLIQILDQTRLHFSSICMLVRYESKY